MELNTHTGVCKTSEICVRKMDCINVSFLSLNYSYARYYHWRRLDEGYTGVIS